jgi:hypothetical protein
MADQKRPVARSQLRALWAALAAATEITPAEVTPPDRVRAVRGEEVMVADADEVQVLDRPDLWPLVADQPLVLAPCELAPRLADLLDLPLTSEEVAGLIESPGQRRPVPPVVQAVLPAAPPAYQAHDRLMAGGLEVPWRYLDGEVHASGPQGLACGLAWAAGRWQLRHVLAALLAAPDATAHLLADADLDPM